MELYHALNRGVDRRALFLDSKDHARFVHDMWEFNDVEDAKNVFYRAQHISGFVNPYIAKERIVDIHAWCLMKNHYHLLISEKVDGGLSKFLRRLNVGYANYFNERYKRQGTLFQGRTKRIPITNDAHFLHILNYIHCNPLDFLKGAENWRLGAIANSSTALTYLSRYKWSSYLDYIDTANFSSVLTKDLFSDVFGNYKKEIADFLKSRDARSLSAYQLEY